MATIDNFFKYFLTHSLLLDNHFADFFLKKVRTIETFSLKLVAMTFSTKKLPKPAKMPLIPFFYSPVCSIVLPRSGIAILALYIKSLFLLY